MKHMVTIDGVEMSLYKAAKLVGVDYYTLDKRIRRRGITAQEAIDFVRINTKHDDVIVDGVKISLHKAAKSLGVSTKTVYDRIRERGMTAQEAIEAVKIDTRCNLNGVEYSSMSHLCDSLNLCRKTIRTRIKRGMTLEEAARIPTRIVKKRNASRKHPLYSTYFGMLNRCNNKNCQDYSDYGGRGIKVCDEWLNDFQQFCKDMGDKPDDGKKYSIERKDTNGNYCKENCKWACNVEQSNNRRSTVMCEIDGITASVKQHAERLGINRHTIYTRLRSGWSIERAFAKTENNLNQLC